MKITLKKAHSIVYQQTTHQITVDIDGTEYIIRHAEDDNGSEYYVSSPNLNNGFFMNLYEMEDGKLKELIEKLANAAYDDYLFGESQVDKEVDLEELENY